MITYAIWHALASGVSFETRVSLSWGQSWPQTNGGHVALAAVHMHVFPKRVSAGRPFAVVFRAVPASSSSMHPCSCSGYMAHSTWDRHGTLLHAYEGICIRYSAHRCGGRLALAYQ